MPYIFNGGNFEKYSMVGDYIVVSDYKTHYYIHARSNVSSGGMYLPKHKLSEKIISALMKRPFVDIGNRHYYFSGKSLRYTYDDGISFIQVEILFRNMRSETELIANVYIGYTDTDGNAKTDSREIYISPLPEDFYELGEVLDQKIDETVQELVEKNNVPYFVEKDYDYPVPSMKRGFRYKVGTKHVYDDGVEYRVDVGDPKVYFKNVKLKSIDNIDDVDFEHPDLYWYGGSIVGMPSDYDKWKRNFEELFGTEVEISSGILAKDYFMGNIRSTGRVGSTITFVIVKDGKIDTSPVLVKKGGKYTIAVYSRKKFSPKASPTAQISLPEGAVVTSEIVAKDPSTSANSVQITFDSTKITIQFIGTSPYIVSASSNDKIKTIALKKKNLKPTFQSIELDMEYGVIA